MEQLSTLSENLPFLASTYNLHAFTGFIIFASIGDLALKGWGMWRASRMNKKTWFIAILIINSVGILPIIFLLLTKEEYRKFNEANAPQEASM